MNGTWKSLNMCKANCHVYEILEENGSVHRIFESPDILRRGRDTQNGWALDKKGHSGLKRSTYDATKNNPNGTKNVQHIAQGLFVPFPDDGGWCTRCERTFDTDTE